MRRTLVVLALAAVFALFATPALAGEEGKPGPGEQRHLAGHGMGAHSPALVFFMQAGFFFLEGCPGLGRVQRHAQGVMDFCLGAWSSG